MSAWREAHSPALKTEEAALLPALPRLGTGGAALRQALGAAWGTAKKQRTIPVSPRKETTASNEPAADPPRVRAALRHAVRKKG